MSSTALVHHTWLMHYSVEILPGGFEQWSEAGITNEFPFLLSDGHLGVPKKILYKLYISASSLFMESRRCNDVHNLLASTSIILLANSAHQTALNARKRLVQSGHLDAQSELSLFAAFMTGCRDCAKQSMVWHQRRWMLHYLSSSSRAFRDLEYEFLDVSLETIRAELQLLSVCCESYPRNYYAWLHRTYCMGLLQKHVVAGTPKSHELLSEDFASLLQWIDRHLSDYTAMDHLCKLVSQFQKHGFEKMQFRTLFNQAVSLISSYPEHEALWMYLRVVLCFVPLEERHEMVTEITEGALGAREEAKRLISYLGKYTLLFKSERNAENVDKTALPY
ncbi:protein prenylyltransferase [Hymenopellis radicata]|nr:protein prenylyltransferase [Hymenopellis radicata]